MTTLTTPAPTRRRAAGRLLAALLIGQFMAVLDATIVTVAAPTMQVDLGASGAALQLIAFRLVQGAGAAMLVPQVLSLIQLTVDGTARARAFSVYSTVLSGASVAGQIVGGVVTSTNIAGTGWRPIFLLNVPLGLALLVAGAWLLPSNRPEAATGLDVGGQLTLSPAVLLLVTPLVLGHQLGWPVWGWAMLAGSAVFFGLFVTAQRRATAPLAPAPVLRAPGLAVAAAAIFSMMAGHAGFLFTMAIYLQDGLGLSPLRASLAFVLSSVGFGAASLNWRRVPARFHRRMIPAGLLLSAMGYLGVAVVTADSGLPGIGYQVAVTVSGIGMGLAFSPALNAALTRVAPTDAANASGLMSTVTQLGQVAGIAGLGAVFLALPVPSRSAAAAATVTNVSVAALVLLSAVFAAFLPTRNPGR